MLNQAPEITMPRFGPRKLALSGWHDRPDAACRTSAPDACLRPATERKTGCPSMP